MPHKRGTLCAALFDVGDGSGPQWFRARIEGTARGGDVEVKYIDHGNSATVAGSKLRPLDRCVSTSVYTDVFFALHNQTVRCIVVLSLVF